MKEDELVVRLANAADSASFRGDHALSALLDEAVGEMEIALEILDKVDSDEARAFVDRHSSELHPAQEAWLQDMKTLQPNHYFKVSETLLREVFSTEQEANQWFALHGCHVAAYGASADGLVAVLRLHNAAGEPRR